MEARKKAVRDFWEERSCGEALHLRGESRESYREQSRIRYEVEPHLPRFAEFDRWRGQRVLEIAVGLGAEHQCFAEAGAVVMGIDLTRRAIDHTKRRFELFGLTPRLSVSDCEELPFADGSFDLVYSWGALHHTPNTARAIEEVRRVLKPGGQARIMIYQKWSLVGMMLWLRYGLLGMAPRTALREIYAKYVESPGTQAFTIEEARRFFAGFGRARFEVVLSQGDLFTASAGQRHQGPLLEIARAVWPRWLIKRLFRNRGLFLMIEAER